MAVALMDVNVLIALAWADHVHHDAAHRWFGRQRDNGWATCAITQCGFVRISSNPRFSPTAAHPMVAINLLAKILVYPGHVFWPGVQLSQAIVVAGLKLEGHLQVTDAYLISLAISHRGRLATFDKRASSISHGKAIDVIPTA